MERWIKEMPPSLGVNAGYSAIGTGTAQSRVLSGDLDFAAMEIPMPAHKLEAGRMVQFPVALGALACVVNLPGIQDGQLQLTGILLADIFSGAIKKWNDARIAEVNPGATLPEMDIRPVSLGEPSGAVYSTTFAFTQYLLATNAEWREKFGPTVTRRWAVGSMVTSSEAMAEVLTSLPGSIGYVPLGTAVSSGLQTVTLRNRNGQAVRVNAASLAATVTRVDWERTPNLVADLIDLPGEGVWPLVLATYALISGEPRDKAKAEAVRAFFKFAVCEGADGASQANAAPLPPAARARVLALMGKADI